ncbi:cleavage stimulation factor subunit 3-like [Lynx canadensis]|uniref:cleavage stimulation factor subunit 3-like n=1 Tax=Lynx canadensis TaxID=61383 RepID=UPI0013C50616|nr:cleavage stimulation factor subunit 3-like [Lynx canadensis]
MSYHFIPSRMVIIIERQLLAAEYVPEKVKKAEKKLEENPYDLDAWSILIREAQV